MVAVCCTLPGEEGGVGEPVGEAVGPLGGGAFGLGAVAEAVAGFAVDVEFGFDAGGFVFEVEAGHAFGDVWAVAVAAGDEDGGHAFFGGEEVGSAGVDEGLEVGAGAGVVDGVWGVGFAGVGLHGGEGGEFATGGEADDADAVGFDVPFGGAGADDAEGAAGVGHGVVLDGVGAVGFAGEAVFEDESGDAAGLEPFGEGATFMAEAEFFVAAAGADDDGGAGGLGGVGEVEGEAGVVDVADVGAFEGFGFGGAGFGAWGAVWPEGEGGGRIVSVKGNE